MAASRPFRIVGEDEADPSQCSISHGSPVAIAWLGKRVGDVVQLGNHELEILSVAQPDRPSEKSCISMR